ncbi:MAG: hypothetical protein JXB49_10815 [Bacteroidales bacterium]|nr:hypothetical protein [Bacteroidales bacterium]
MKNNYRLKVVKYNHMVFGMLILTFLSCKKELNEDIKESDHGITTLSGTYSWKSIAIGGGGFVTGFTTCPTEQNLIYMRTDVGGAYRWIEETQSWKPVTDFVNSDETSLLGIESIAIDPASPNKVYIAAGTEYWDEGLSCILISSDYGETFAKIDVTSQFTFHGNGMGRQNGERLVVDPNKGNILFCGTRKNGLWKSENSGQTWSLVRSFPITTTSNNNGICFIQFDESSASNNNATQIIYVGISRVGGTNIYVSKNAGNTWDPLPNSVTDYMPMRCLLRNEFLYVTYGNAEGPWNTTTGLVIKYNTATDEKSTISPETGNAFSGITISTDNSILLVSSINKWINQGGTYGDEIYRSTDGGSSWTRLFQDKLSSLNNGGIGWISGSSLHWAGDIKIDPYNKDRAFVTSGNGVFMTTNLTSGNPIWVFTSKGLEETVPYDVISIPGGPTISVIADYDGYTHHDVAQYPSKNHYPTMGTCTGLAYASKKPNFVVRVGGSENNKAMYYSEDTGFFWKRVPTNSIGKYAGKVAISADGECILWSPGGSSVYWTTDIGATWNTCNGISGSFAPVADYENPNVFYAYSAGKIYISNDKGKSFLGFDTGFSGGGKLIRAIPGKEGHVLIPAGSSGLYITKDKGTTFTQIETVTRCDAVSAGKPAEGSNYPSIFIYGITVDDSNLGIHRSDDIGETWVRCDDDDHQFGSLANGGFVVGDNNIFGRVYRSTAGRGIVYGDID